jgi:hypothetical protein
LILVQPTVSALDLVQFRSQRLEFAAARSGPLIVILARVGELLPWQTIPYAWPLTAESHSMRYLVAGSWPAGKSSGLRVQLVDAGQQRVVGCRNLRCDAEFSGFLHEAIRAQAHRPFDPHQYVQAIAATVMDRTPVPEQFGGEALRAVVTERDSHSTAWKA